MIKLLAVTALAGAGSCRPVPMQFGSAPDGNAGRMSGVECRDTGGGSGKKLWPTRAGA